MLQSKSSRFLLLVGICISVADPGRGFPINTVSSKKVHYDTKAPGARAAGRSASVASGTALETTLSCRGGSLYAASPGLGAALASPLASAIGFMFWDKNWHGSAFALNLVKNILASGFFLATLSACGAVPNPFAEATPLLPLAISAFFGVVVGDSTAIASLRRLGSRRYLLIDCLKPALSTAVGVLAFGEKVTLKMSAGVFAVILGVFIASSQKVATTSGIQEEKDKASIFVGYALAVAHLFLDTAGAAITKRYSKGAVGPLGIGLLRFGSAAVMLSVIGGAGRVITGKSKTMESQWYAMPKTVTQNPSPFEMTKANWRAIAIGTFFVTFLGPTLFMRSLLLMPLGIAVTLSCLAPLYEPALARILRGVRVNPAAVLGAVMAFGGVAALSL